MSTRRRPLRLVFSLVVSTSLIGAMLASTAVAATANIDIGGGSAVNTPARAGAPPQVSPGNVAGFNLWIQNDDAANLPTFFMGAVTAATAASPVGGYWSNDPINGPFHPCPITDAQLGCTFGGLNSGEVVYVTAAFTVSATTSLTNCSLEDGEDGFSPIGVAASWACVDFRFAAEQGNVVSDKKHKSRGDAFHWFDFVATDTLTDEAAQFPFCNLSIDDNTIETCPDGPLKIFNSEGANRNNVQSTQLTAPRGAFNSKSGSTGLGVADNFDFDCPTGVLDDVPNCATHEGSGAGAFVGQWSQIDVNSEQHFIDQTIFIEVKLTMYGVNPSSIEGVEHIYQDAAGNWHEAAPIGTPCLTSGGPAVGQTTECFWASGTGNVTTVLVWMHDNGRIRTF
jgi:hypothetical protein